MREQIEGVLSSLPELISLIGCTRSLLIVESASLIAPSTTEEYRDYSATNDQSFNERVASDVVAREIEAEDNEDLSQAVLTCRIGRITTIFAMAQPKKELPRIMS